MVKQEDTKTAPGKISAVKKILLWGLVIMALTGGSVGATLYLQGQLDKLAPGGSVAVTVSANGAAAPVVHKDPPLYLPLDPPLVVNFEDQGVLRYLQVSLAVMTRDKAMIETVTNNLPPIRNNLIMLFGKQDFATLVSTEGREKLRSQALEEIQSILRQEIGKSGVEAVYFTNFIMQ